MIPQLVPPKWSEDDSANWLQFTLSDTGKKLYTALCEALPSSGYCKDPSRALGAIEAHRQVILLLKLWTQVLPNEKPVASAYPDIDDESQWKEKDPSIS